MSLYVEFKSIIKDFLPSLVAIIAVLYTSKNITKQASEQASAQAKKNMQLQWINSVRDKTAKLVSYTPISLANITDKHMLISEIIVNVTSLQLMLDNTNKQMHSDLFAELNTFEKILIRYVSKNNNAEVNPKELGELTAKVLNLSHSIILEEQNKL